MSSLSTWWHGLSKPKYFLLSGLLLGILLFCFSGMPKVSADLVRAYSAPQIYEKAIALAQADTSVHTYLGTLQPLDALAIIEGDVHYSAAHDTIYSTTRLKGTLGRAHLDLIAFKKAQTWEITSLVVRIKQPPEHRQSIVIY